MLYDYNRFNQIGFLHDKYRLLLFPRTMAGDVNRLCGKVVNNGGAYIYIGSGTSFDLGDHSDLFSFTYVGESTEWGKIINSRHDSIGNWWDSDWKYTIVFTTIDDSWNQDDLLYLKERIFELLQEGSFTPIGEQATHTGTVYSGKKEELDRLIKMVASYLNRQGFLPIFPLTSLR